MKHVLDFLGDLRQNNNKAWFDGNVPRHKDAKTVFNQTVEQLIDSIGTFDQGIRGVTLKESTYRIYRDIRFSPDKTPYKTHMGAYICPDGKKSGNAGYYFHVEPGNSLLAAGLHCPDTKIVKSVREDIYALFAEFEHAIECAKGFKLDYSSMLKRTPREFPHDAPSANYLKLKEFDLILPLTDKQIIAKDMIDQVVKAFHSAKPFNDFLNRSISYVKEDNYEQGL